MRRRTSRDTPRDRGAVAIEFALLLPVLLLLLFGIIDFGRALNASITLTQAAREGARFAAVADAIGLPNTSAAVKDRTVAAATGLNLTSANVTPTTCTANETGDATVKVTYVFKFITPVAAISSMLGSTFGSSMTLTATGVMPCET
jgi:Flp pilus assembly protein TadG